jgi:peptidyl-prolyl cis-trans isomerase D
MLDTLRANSRSVLTYVLFGIIIVVFVVSFGPGSRGCTSGSARAATWAAKVNGATVSPGEFQQQFETIRRMYAGVDLDQVMLGQLRQMALDQLVNHELVDQESSRQGIVVTDDELSTAIQAIPTFQRDGAFNVEMYKQAVTGQFGSTSRFEDRMRHELAYGKMLSLVRETAKVTDEEVKDAYLAESDKVNLEFARFPVSLARADVRATDEQVKAYAETSKARIAQYYKDNPTRFDKKERVRARHILIRVPPNGTKELEDEAKKKIDELAARVKKGEDFAKLAEQYSEDPGSKERGGDLGEFTHNVMVKQFDDAAFALKPGEVSDPVKTPFGWHIIKVEQKIAPEVISLEKATPDIARDMVEADFAKLLARSKAEETLKKLQAGKSFADVLPADDKKGAKPLKLGGQVVKFDETGLFNASSSPNVPRIGPAPELFADALKANTGQVLPRVYESSAGPIVARVKERQRADPAQFEKKKADVENQLRLRRQVQLEQAWVRSLKDKAKVEVNAALLRGELTSGPVEPLD